MAKWRLSKMGCSIISPDWPAVSHVPPRFGLGYVARSDGPCAGRSLRRAADGNLPRPKRIQARYASECVNPGIHSLALRACIGKKLSAARLIARGVPYDEVAADVLADARSGVETMRTSCPKTNRRGLVPKRHLYSFTQDRLSRMPLPINCAQVRARGYPAPNSRLRAINCVLPVELS